jgi:hypothetical protein
LTLSRAQNCDFLGLNNAMYQAQPHEFTPKSVAEIAVDFYPDIHIYDYGQAQ